MSHIKSVSRSTGFQIFIFTAVFAAAIAAILLLMRYWFDAKPPLHFAIWASVFLAFVTPTAIIIIRHEIRLSRIKLIDLFADTFNFAQPSQQAGQIQLFDPRGAQNVSFEFVKGKYFVDLDLPPNQTQTAENVPRFPMMIRSDWMMLICAIPFMVIAWFGSFILFAPMIEVLKIGSESAVGSWLWPSMLAIGGADSGTIYDTAQFQMQHANVLTVAVLAFSGAYFFSLRLLLRAVAVFDLSPVTFLRCFVHILLAMLLAVVIYRVFPSGEGFANALARTGQAIQTLAGAPPPAPAATAPRATAPPPPAATGSAPGAAAAAPETLTTAATEAARGSGPSISSTRSATAPPASNGASTCVADRPCPGTGAAAGVSAIWLILAFALGFIPDAALQFVLQKSGLTFKERYKDLDPHAKLVPVTVIDGIDNFIAYRLEEANIFDVQNLATANPIMMHIESPFGIYETIDWVAQAQLCTVTGPDRFLMLKTLNIRTIFDLERAVMKPVPDSEVETLIDRAAAAAANAARATAYADVTRLSLAAASAAVTAAEKKAHSDDQSTVEKAKAAAGAADNLARKAAEASKAANELAGASADAVNKFVAAAMVYAAFDPIGADRLMTASLLPVVPGPAAIGSPEDGAKPEENGGKPENGAKPGEAANPPPEPGADVIKTIGRVLVRDSERDSAMRKALNLGGPAYADPAGPSVDSIRHMVMVMLDDLHVHRLRQVWKHISRQLGAANGHL